MDMWQERGQALDPSWTKQWDGRRGEGQKRKRGGGGIEKGEFWRERDSTFSLNLSEIGPTVSSGVRGRVHPHGKGFA